MLSEIKANVGTKKVSIIIVFCALARFLITIKMTTSNTLLYRRFIVFKKLFQSHNFYKGFERLQGK